MRRLYLGQCPINDADLPLLAKFPRLELVSFQKSKITNAGMKSLKECKGLKTIYLSQVDITNEGLKELAELPELNVLMARVTRATAEGFRPFQNSKSLKTLVIDGVLAFKNGPTHEEVQDMLLGVEVRSMLKR